MKDRVIIKIVQKAVNCFINNLISIKLNCEYPNVAGMIIMEGGRPVANHCIVYL